MIHAADTDNGEVWTHFGNQVLSTLKGLQNIQIYYVVILREKGAVYYMASRENGYGTGSYPNMRPIAIDPWNENNDLYAGI
ncbi:hypothetical nucleotide-binding protein [Richelia intracellularis]|nr:hypothetical nucleotide-binding protein [Richelia intracellularis]